MAVVLLKGREAPKQVRSTMETMIQTRADVQAWQVPTFQRPIRINDKVRALAEELKNNGGIVPGVITLGIVEGDKTIWLPDGQHRREAFLMTELAECIMDVRLCNFASMPEMAQEFVELNSKLVNMRPDDILRGLESTLRSLKAIREACPFVGYGNIRRNDASSPLLSMSAVLRCWSHSGGDTPHAGGQSALQLAEELDEVQTLVLIKFLAIARSAWGNEQESFRLWGNLNMTMCMWVYRRMVVEKDRDSAKRYTPINDEQFRKCLMELAADGHYNDWLVGRKMGDRDRAPCYARIRAAFVRRMQHDTNKKINFIQPGWTS